MGFVDPIGDEIRYRQAFIEYIKLTDYVDPDSETTERSLYETLARNKKYLGKTMAAQLEERHTLYGQGLEIVKQQIAEEGQAKSAAATAILGPTETAAPAAAVEAQKNTMYLWIAAALLLGVLVLR